MPKPYLQFWGFLKLMILLSTTNFAQIAQDYSVNASGMTWTQSNGSISFTVGEIVIPMAADNNGNSISGGIVSTCSLEIIQVESIELTAIDLVAYPNPSSDLINVKINGSNIDKFQLCISDVNGVEKYSGQFYGIKNIIGINVHSFASGIYILYVLNTANQKLGTFRIIKY